MATFKNPFYNPKYPLSTPEIHTDAIPEEYRGFLIYRQSYNCYYIVKNGVCVSMRAGPNGARNHIDKIENGKISPEHLSWGID